MRTSRQSGMTAAQIAAMTSFLVASYFIVIDAGEYLRSFSTVVYGRFWPVRNELFLHIATGALALILGAAQFCLAYFRRTSALHRWIGRAYVSAVAVSCIASLAVIRNGSVIGTAWVVLLVLLSASALLFTAIGFIEARRRRWNRHAAWMFRSYMAMMVFAWFRLIMELPVLEDMPPRARATMVLALTMVMAGSVTEVILRRVAIKLKPALEYAPASGELKSRSLPSQDL
jgi:hypothetical protein